VISKTLSGYDAQSRGKPLLPILKPRNRSTWNARVARAQQRAEERSAASEVLTFYVRVLEFQRALYEGCQKSRKLAEKRSGKLRENLDWGLAVTALPDLVVLVQRHGPSTLADQSDQLTSVAGLKLASGWLNSDAQTYGPASFFSRVVLEPQAEYLAETETWLSGKVAGNRCPNCESLPQLAVIRPEGDGGKRMLLCSLCHSEWEFRRILCSSCGEENHEKLPRYIADGVPAVRVEACDSCGKYLKSVDLTLDGLAVPEVDEVATAALDVWATEHGYSKIQSNIMGF